jgi:hypothetical protein
MAVVLHELWKRFLKITNKFAGTPFADFASHTISQRETVIISHFHSLLTSRQTTSLSTPFKQRRNSSTQAVMTPTKSITADLLKLDISPARGDQAAPGKDKSAADLRTVHEPNVHSSIDIRSPGLIPQDLNILDSLLESAPGVSFYDLDFDAVLQRNMNQFKLVSHWEIPEAGESKVVTSDIQQPEYPSPKSPSPAEEISTRIIMESLIEREKTVWEYTRGYIAIEGPADWKSWDTITLIKRSHPISRNYLIDLQDSSQQRKTLPDWDRMLEESVGGDF